MTADNKSEDKKFSFYPLTPERWEDFEKLFGERGACGGCWCMFWRQTSADFEKNKGDKNKKLMKQLVTNGQQAGIIAYSGKEPVGWCSFAPRENYVRLENSRILKRVDKEPVWSVSCFFIKKDFRRQGLSVELLKAVIKYCEKKKVKILEGYPTVPYDKNMPAVFAWTGISSAFDKTGFKEIMRRSKTRPVMRYKI
jgi:GNAT superfamily N-acetyltransferase